LQGVTTAILFGEIRYAYLRENKLGFEIARAAIEAEANLRVVAVTASLAIHAAELRRKYYSKKNVFSYNDGLYLATGLALAEKAALIITTDPHLLNVRDLKTMAPSTTVSLTLVHDVAARTSIQFSDDVASEQEAQGGDGIGHVTLRALGCRAGCNLGVGKIFLIE
jgi:predicted nucleic acid-binding protein